MPKPNFESESEITKSIREQYEQIVRLKYLDKQKQTMSEKSEHQILERIIELERSINEITAKLKKELEVYIISAIDLLDIKSLDYDQKLLMMSDVHSTLKKHLSHIVTNEVVKAQLNKPSLDKKYVDDPHKFFDLLRDDFDINEASQDINDTSEEHPSLIILERFIAPGAVFIAREIQDYWLFFYGAVLPMSAINLIYLLITDKNSGETGILIIGFYLLSYTFLRLLFEPRVDIEDREKAFDGLKYNVDGYQPTPFFNRMRRLIHKPLEGTTEALSDEDKQKDSQNDE